jgi:hypothetical protein
MTNDEEKQQELSEIHTTVLKSKPGRTQHSKLPSMCASVVVQHISVDLRSGASDGVRSEFLKRAVLSDPFTVHGRTLVCRSNKSERRATRAMDHSVRRMARCAEATARLTTRMIYCRVDYMCAPQVDVCFLTVYILSHTVRAARG